MNKTLYKPLAFLLFFVALLEILPTAYAATPISEDPQASKYFSSTEVSCYATGGGKVTVEVSINATHTMTSLGPTKIRIFGQQSDGSYQVVKTYSGGMLESNSAFAYTSKTYQGVSGKKYYAIATLYAKNSSGSQTMYQSSYTITA